MAKAAGRSSFSATSAEASTQSSQVALVAGQRDAGLLEERGVGEAAGQRELGHEAGDGVGAVGAHPVERVAEVGAPVVGVVEVGGQVEPVVGLLLEVGDPGDVGALAGLELDRQLLLDHLVGDVVEDDVDAGVLRHEAVEQVLDDLALDAVGVPHHPHVAGVGGRWPAAA